MDRFLKKRELLWHPAIEHHFAMNLDAHRHYVFSRVCAVCADPAELLWITSDFLKKAAIKL